MKTTISLISTIIFSLSIFITVSLQSCGPSLEEIEISKQPFIYTVTHPYEFTLESGQTFTTDVCTKMNEAGEDYIRETMCKEIKNYWDQNVAKGIKSFRRLENKEPIIHSQPTEEPTSNYTNGLIIILPEKHNEISRDKTFKESLSGYISNDTLYIEFNH